MHFCLVNQNAAGTVHRLDGIILVVNNRGVHVLLVMIPVSACLPQMTAEYDGRLNFVVPGRPVYLAPVIDQFVLHDHALGEEEGESRAFLHQSEYFKLLAQFSVVALFGLLEHGEVFLKLRRLREGNAVDAAEHFVFGIPAPVRARAVCKAPLYKAPAYPRTA